MTTVASDPAARPHPDLAPGCAALPVRTAPQRPGPVTRTRSLLLNADETAPRCARRTLAQALADWNLGHLAGLRERSEAVCSELVTNARAISVAKAPPGTEPAPVVLTLAVEGGDLLLCVWDADSTPPPRDDSGELPDLLAESGRGLFIVGKYSSRWGWHPGPTDGKFVWSAIPLDAPPPDWPEGSQ